MGVFLLQDHVRLQLVRAAATGDLYVTDATEWNGQPFLVDLCRRAILSGYSFRPLIHEAMAFGRHTACGSDLELRLRARFFKAHQRSTGLVGRLWSSTTDELVPLPLH